MLNFLNSNNKTIVGVSLTPGLGLEGAIYKRGSNALQNYARRKVDYDFQTREIRDWAQFRAALSEIFEELGVSNPLVYMVLPNVYFDFESFSTSIENDIIYSGLQSKLEDNYLFKKDSPVIGMMPVVSDDPSMTRYAFTAYKSSIVTELKETAEELKFKLIGIESNYSATLRGLHAAGLLDDVLLEQNAWTTMLINNNSFILFNIEEGKNLVEIAEIPLAIKSFTTEEAYQAIISNSVEYLQKFNPQTLYIVSQTEEINAKVLKNLMQFDKEVVTVNSNLKYGEEPIIEVLETKDHAAINSITLAVLGASVPKTKLDISLNLLAGDKDASDGIHGTINFMGKPLDITNSLIAQVCLIIMLIAGGSLGGIGYLMQMQSQAIEDEIASAKRQSDTIQQQIDALKPKEVKEEIDMTQIIDDVAQKNVSAINFYDSISSDIPKNVWLTKYYNNSGDKIAVRGIAQSIVDIYEYYKNLRIVSPQSNIKLNELKVITEDMGAEDRKFLNNLNIDRDTDRLYSFEISNTAMKTVATKSSSSSRGNDGPNESDILNGSQLPPASLEETSGQMTPTN